MAQNLIFGMNVIGRTTFQVTTFHVPSVHSISWANGVRTRTQIWLDHHRAYGGVPFVWGLGEIHGESPSCEQDRPVGEATG